MVGDDGPHGMTTASSVNDHSPSEGHVLTDRARLYDRAIGEGRPIIVLHGGPDFDHHYLRPEMDRLAASFRLVYYDQRGRGRSAGHVQPEEVSIASEIEDLDAVRRHSGFASAALLATHGVAFWRWSTRHATPIACPISSSSTQHRDRPKIGWLSGNTSPARARPVTSSVCRQSHRAPATELEISRRRWSTTASTSARQFRSTNTSSR